MNKETFLKNLERELKAIPAEDREDALSYYREYLDEMGADESMDVTQRVGSPRDLARTIISECADKHVEKQEREGGIKNGTTAVWMVILGIFAAPIAVPLAFAGVMVLFAFVLVGFAIGLTFMAAAVSAVVAGACMVPATFVAGSLAQSVVCLGLVLVGGGLAIILYYSAQEIYQVCIKCVTAGYRRFASRRERK